MKSTHPLLSMPALTHMHPGNPHGLRFAEGDGGDEGSGGDGGTGDQGKDGASGDGVPQVNEHGFPEKTPLTQMTDAQQAAYWKYHARKHETAASARADYEQIKAERDQLRQAGMTADEKALEDAKTAAREEARAAERNTWAPRLVRAELSGALRARGMKDEQVAALIGPLDHNHFLTDSGEVDADKVSNYAAGFGRGEQWPDTGQGRRGSHAAEKSVGAGRDLFRDRKKK